MVINIDVGFFGHVHLELLCEQECYPVCTRRVL